jgi:hypothetical protein
LAIVLRRERTVYRSFAPTASRSQGIVAFTSREFGVSASAAFAVLSDPETYPRWLVGAQAIRSVDASWPQPGSKFHHVVGFGPVRIPDNTEVLDIDDAERVLRLKVRARPLISAVATFRVIGSAERCVITLQEEPTLRVVGNLVRPLMDPATHVRNHRSLRRLGDVFEQDVGTSSVARSHPTTQ